MSDPFDAYAARKSLLMMKAQLQRMELGHDIDQLKQEFAWMGALGRVRQAFSGNPWGVVGALGGQALKKGLQQYPRLGLLASAVLYKFKGPIAKAALKAGVLACVAAGAKRLFKRGSH